MHHGSHRRVWQHRAGDRDSDCLRWYVALPAVSYSAYVGGSGTMNNLDLTGCTAAMLFANASGGDYSPVKGGAKPCTLVDQGTNVGAPDHDYAGTPRPQPIGGTDDVGAYEAR